MTRRQLPPQVRKIETVDRRTGKTVVQYKVTADAGKGSRPCTTPASRPYEGTGTSWLPWWSGTARCRRRG